MNKTPIIISITAVALIVAGTIVWQVSKKDKAPEQVAGDQVAATSPKPEESKDKKMAFTEFAKQKGSYQCTVSQSVQGITSDGKVYLNDGKIRADFSADYNGMKVSGSAIIRDGYSYAWSSMSPMGFKVAVNPDTDSSGSVKVNGNTYSWNADQIGEYDCQPWSVNASLFVVPTNITFQEMKS